MKSKKIICCAIALIMALGVSGCKKDATTNKGGDNTVLTLYLPGEQQKEHDLVMEKVNGILEEKIGASLDLLFINDGDFDEKMKLKMAANEKYDMTFTGYINQYVKAVNNGGFLPLNDLIEKEAPGLKEAIPQFWWDAITMDGEVYAVPNQQIAAIVKSVTMEKGVAEKYGINEDTVKHINDLAPYLEKIKNDTPSKYAYRPGDEGTLMWTVKEYEEITTGLAIKKGDPEAKLVKLYETPEYLDGVKTLQDWFKKGYIRPDIASVMDDNSDFLAHKYVVTVTGWKPGFEVNQAANLGGEHIAVKLGGSLITTSNCNATMYAISATSKNPEKSIKFINEMNTNEELYNLVCFGIEGKHYEKKEDGTVTVIPDSGYNPNADWKFGNQFNGFVRTGQPLDVWEQTLELNNSAEKSVLLGFNMVTDNIVTELSQIETVDSEFAALEKGCDDYEKLLPQYKQKMQEAGIDAVQKELQKQIDEFLKNKK